MVLAEPIVLKKKSARQQALQKHPFLTRTLETGLIVETAILGGLLGGKAGIAKAGKGALSLLKSPKKVLLATATIPTAVGVLKSSKKARETAKNALSPSANVARGEKIGELIEGKKSLADVLELNKESTLKEQILEGAKKAGIVGAGAVAVTGGAVLAKKAIEEIKQKRTLGTLEKAQPVDVLGSGLQAPKIQQVSPVSQLSEVPSSSGQVSLKNASQPLTIVQIKI